MKGREVKNKRDPRVRSSRASWLFMLYSYVFLVGVCFLLTLLFSIWQKKLVENMTREGTLADAQTDKIMKQHQKQVDKLNAQIDM